VAAQPAYEILLERILLGDYLPGASLLEKEIAEDLGMSRTPVREALLRLKLEGMIRVIPRVGIFVAEASVNKIREVTEVRVILEEYLARMAVERCREELLAEFGNWLEKESATWDRLPPKERKRRDEEFHMLMSRAAGNETLARQLTLLRNQAALFWGQSLDRASLEESLQDFKEAYDALRARDGERCARVLCRHVLDNVERIQNFMKPQPLELAVSLER